MLVGYARVSTRDQCYQAQLDALREARCEKIFEEKLSGAQRDRPQLQAALDYVRPGGRLVFHVFGALAEFERSIIRERTAAGLAAARARGRVGGRPKALSKSDLHIAQTLLQDGKLTVAQIAQRLGVAPSTLYKHLPRPRSTITEQAPE